MSRRQDATTIRVAGPLRDRLRTEAEARDVSIAWLANRLLAEALDQLAPAEDFRLVRERDPS